MTEKDCIVKVEEITDSVIYVYTDPEIADYIRKMPAVIELSQIQGTKYVLTLDKRYDRASVLKDIEHINIVWKKMLCDALVDVIVDAILDLSDEEFDALVG